MTLHLHSAWSHFFPKSPPVRHLLRKIYPDRWVRMHSLPGAKRFPGSANEEVELHRRHLTVADRIVADSPCALVVSFPNGYDGRDEPRSLRSIGYEIDDSWIDEWSTVSELRDEIEGMTFAVLSLSSLGSDVGSSVLARVFSDVAQGKTASLLLFALDTGRVYSPYDGGADVFAENVGSRDLLRVELGDWASSRDDGL